MFKFSCHPDGGASFEVVARSRAIAAWENAPGQPKGERRSVGEFSKKLSMTDSMDLAWYAASKAGLTDLDIISWRQQVDVDFMEYEDEDGTGSGPTTPVAP